MRCTHASACQPNNPHARAAVINACVVLIADDSQQLGAAAVEPLKDAEPQRVGETLPAKAAPSRGPSQHAPAAPAAAKMRSRPQPRKQAASRRASAPMQAAPMQGDQQQHEEDDQLKQLAAQRRRAAFLSMLRCGVAAARSGAPVLLAPSPVCPLSMCMHHPHARVRRAAPAGCWTRARRTPRSCRS